MDSVSRLSGAITPFLSGAMDPLITGAPPVGAFSPSYFTPPTLCSAHSGSESSGGRLWKAAGVVAILGAAGYLVHKATDRGPDETRPVGVDVGSLSGAEEAQYTAIQDFCRAKGADFSEVHQLASVMLKASTQMNRWTPGRYPSSERLKALFLASFLTSLPKSAFYDAKNSREEERNKEFVDTVLAYARRGKLRMAASTSQAHIQDWAMGEYDSQHTSIYLKRLPDPSDLLAKMTIVHELYHFYQDIQGKTLSLLEAESQAFIQAGTFLLFDQGLDSEERVNEFFRGHSSFSEEKQIFQVAGIWVAHHQLEKGGNEKALKDWMQKLEDLIEKRYGAQEILTAFLKRSQDLFAQIRKKESRNLIQKKMADQERVLEREKGKLLAYLEKSPDACRDDVELRKQRLLVFEMLINRFLFKLAEKFPEAEDIELVSGDPEIKATLQMMAPLRLTANIFCSKSNGVK
jgi:hypothetical protein